MPLYSALISSIFLTSTVLAQTRQHVAGITLMGPMQNERFARIETSFIVPHLSGPANSVASLFVAVDGADDSNCPTSVYVGVDLQVDQQGTTSYKAWYQLAPSDRKNMHLDISEGQTLKMGWSRPDIGDLPYLWVNTVGTGQNAIVAISNGTCGSSVTWGLEAVPIDNESYHDVVNFAPITFYGARAYTSRSNGYGPENTTINNVFDMLDSEGVTQVGVYDWLVGERVTFLFKHQ